MHDAVGALNVALRRANDYGLEVRLDYEDGFQTMKANRYRAEVWQRLKPA